MHARRRFDREAIWWMVLVYPWLFALGYLSKSLYTGPAAIWPAHALTFVAYLLLPWRLWGSVAAGILAWELVSRPLLHWATNQTQASWKVSFGFALADIVTTAAHLDFSVPSVTVTQVWMRSIFCGSELVQARIGDVCHGR